MPKGIATETKKVQIDRGLIAETLSEADGVALIDEDGSLSFSFSS